MRKTPLRQCVGCQEQKPKRTMIRVVLTPEGDILLDPTGKKSGRGSYICNHRACFEQAKKRRSLDRGLKTQVTDQVYDQLLAQIEAHEIEH